MFLSRIICTPATRALAPRVHTAAVIAPRMYCTDLPRPRAAVVLSGCGVYDGAEITESVSLLVHLASNHVEYTCFAPNRPQAHVVNHATGVEDAHPRNALEEAARIARGNIADLASLRVTDYDALFVPGGFGAAKNLSDFGFKGANFSVAPDVEAALSAFHAEGKPIGLCCIAPVLAAKAIPGCEVTLGSDDTTDPRWPHAGAAGAVAAVGSKHVATRDPYYVHTDARNRLVTTPAYMFDGSPDVIFAGVGGMVQAVLRLLHGQ